MPTTKCPLCDSPCIIKIVSAADARYLEVDVCKMCGTMYPRGGKTAKAGPAKATKAAKGKAPKSR